MNRTRKQQTDRGLPSSESDLLSSPGALSVLRRRLLAWFNRHQRNLPWRNDRDPYRIWVSEVMLQQTQVATVVPYFQRFLEAFPTVHDLAQADEQDVLLLWEGLGYYRRARDLLRAAQFLVANHKGCLVDEPAAWKELPGVGRYILGAVLSQAFDRRLPIVEANSKRVLCRLFGNPGDPASAKTAAWLWQTAEILLPGKRAGDFNQAMMELGALLCTPVAPRCDVCPLSYTCTARKEGSQESIPTRAVPLATESVREVAIVVKRRNNVLLVRRSPLGRWPNMWEFPHLAVEENETDQKAAQRAVDDLLRIRAEIGPEIMTIRHSVTRFRITLVALAAKFRSGDMRLSYYEEGRWLPVAALRDYPVSSPQRLLAERIARPVR